MRNYRELRVWAKAHALALKLYGITREFPREEMYGLTSQIRRAASSIGANLAEGCGTRTDAELARYLLIAMGSASELDYHLLLARDLHILNNSDHAVLEEELSEVRRMLTSLLLKLKSASRELTAKS